MLLQVCSPKMILICLVHERVADGIAAGTYALLSKLRLLKKMNEDGDQPSFILFVGKKKETIIHLASSAVRICNSSELQLLVSNILKWSHHNANTNGTCLFEIEYSYSGVVFTGGWVGTQSADVNSSSCMRQHPSMISRFAFWLEKFSSCAASCMFSSKVISLWKGRETGSISFS